MSSKRTILVTGAGRGIGRAISDHLAQKGHFVIGLARSRLDAEWAPGRYYSVDLSDREQTALTLTEITGEYAVDGLVNNVGLVRPQSAEEVTPGDLDAVLDLNLRVSLQAMQAVAPSMKARKWGRVVNISSLTALGGLSRTSYAAAKAAMIAVTRCWALEFAGYGITVNAVAPGPTETELFRSVYPAGSEKEKRYLETIPMGRFGNPEEVAAAAAFLLSDEAAFITGQTLFVDGGSSIGRLLV